MESAQYASRSRYLSTPYFVAIFLGSFCESETIKVRREKKLKGVVTRKRHYNKRETFYSLS